MGLAEALVFPAYAGVSPPLGVGLPSFIGIPRLCGGEPAYRQLTHASALYSPPMRG